MAFRELVSIAACIDRLADTAQASSRRPMRVDEVLPNRNYPPRVSTNLIHVGPIDVVSLGTQCRLKRADLGFADRDEDRFAAVTASATNAPTSLTNSVGPA